MKEIKTKTKYLCPDCGKRLFALRKYKNGMRYSSEFVCDCGYNR